MPSRGASEEVLLIASASGVLSCFTRLCALFAILFPLPRFPYPCSYLLFLRGSLPRLQVYTVAASTQICGLCFLNTVDSNWGAVESRHGSNFRLFSTVDR
jgi:hypothetical protein